MPEPPVCRPVWFGAPGDAVLGQLHAPPERACGGVVLVGPIGYEGVCAHRSLRRLAERLAVDGWVALRFDLPGTGDSSGGLDAALPARWRSAMAAAVATVRATTAGPVVALGVRVGALVAAGADVDGLVLWDPVRSGHDWIRQSSALAATALGVPAGAAPDGSVEVVGERLDAAVVEALRSMRLPEAASVPTLALLHRERPTTSLERLLGGWSSIEVGDAVGQHRTLESSTAVVPQAIVERVARWVAGLAGAPVHAVALPPPAGAAAVEGPAGQVVERPERLGPAGLFAVVAEPTAGPIVGTLVCLNNAGDYHIGPGRSWVDWGRGLAAGGWQVVRIDTPGVGDSPTAPGALDDCAYPAGGGVDLGAAVTDLAARSPVGGPTVVAGLCSGGRLATHVADAAGADGVVALNAFWHLPYRLLTTIRPADPYPAAIARLDARRARYHLAARVPAALQRRVAPHGGAELRAAVEAGRRVVLVYGPDEFGLARLRAAYRWVPGALAAAGGALDVVDGLDHAMLRPGPRAEALDRVAAHLADWAATR